MYQKIIGILLLLIVCGGDGAPYTAVFSNHPNIKLVYTNMNDDSLDTRSISNILDYFQILIKKSMDSFNEPNPSSVLNNFRDIYIDNSRHDEGSKTSSKPHPISKDKHYSDYFYNSDSSELKSIDEYDSDLIFGSDESGECDHEKSYEFYTDFHQEMPKQYTNGFYENNESYEISNSGNFQHSIENFDQYANYKDEKPCPHIVQETVNEILDRLAYQIAQKQSGNLKKPQEDSLIEGKEVENWKQKSPVDIKESISEPDKNKLEEFSDIIKKIFTTKEEKPNLKIENEMSGNKGLAVEQNPPTMENEWKCDEFVSKEYYKEYTGPSSEVDFGMGIEFTEEEHDNGSEEPIEEYKTIKEANKGNSKNQEETEKFKNVFKPTSEKNVEETYKEQEVTEAPVPEAENDLTENLQDPEPENDGKSSLIEEIWSHILEIKDFMKKIKLTSDTDGSFNSEDKMIATGNDKFGHEAEIRNPDNKKDVQTGIEEDFQWNEDEDQQKNFQPEVAPVKTEIAEDFEWDEDEYQEENLQPEVEQDFNSNEDKNDKESGKPENTGNYQEFLKVKEIPVEKIVENEVVNEVLAKYLKSLFKQNEEGNFVIEDSDNEYTDKHSYDEYLKQKFYSTERRFGESVENQYKENDVDRKNPVKDEEILLGKSRIDGEDIDFAGEVVGNPNGEDGTKLENSEDGQKSRKDNTDIVGGENAINEKDLSDDGIEGEIISYEVPGNKIDEEEIDEDEMDSDSEQVGLESSLNIDEVVQKLSKIKSEQSENYKKEINNVENVAEEETSVASFETVDVSEGSDADENGISEEENFESQENDEIDENTGNDETDKKLLNDEINDESNKKTENGEFDIKAEIEKKPGTDETDEKLPNDEIDETLENETDRKAEKDEPNAEAENDEIDEDPENIQFSVEKNEENGKDTTEINKSDQNVVKAEDSEVINNVGNGAVGDNIAAIENAAQEEVTQPEEEESLTRKRRDVEVDVKKLKKKVLLSQNENKPKFLWTDRKNARNFIDSDIFEDNSKDNPTFSRYPNVIGDREFLIKYFYSSTSSEELEATKTRVPRWADPGYYDEEIPMTKILNYDPIIEYVNAHLVKALEKKDKQKPRFEEDEKEHQTRIDTNSFKALKNEYSMPDFDREDLFDDIKRILENPPAFLTVV